jgi:hypothetical protein
MESIGALDVEKKDFFETLAASHGADQGSEDCAESLAWKGFQAHCRGSIGRTPNESDRCARCFPLASLIFVFFRRRASYNAHT